MVFFYASTSIDLILHQLSTPSISCINGINYLPYQLDRKSNHPKAKQHNKQPKASEGKDKS
jgi:hypothetical protein